MEFCKDLGLKRLQKGTFLGKLTREERNAFEENLKRHLIGIKDNFYIIPLCADCWHKKISKYYEPEKQILQPQKPFKIIS